MRKIITMALLFGATYSNGQIASSLWMDESNVNANVSDGGIFFNSMNNSSSGYEVPKGGGAHSIYAMSFWFGGTDVNGQLKMAGQRYDSFKDFYPGPLTIGDANPPAAGTWNVPLLAVTKDEINAHISNNQNPQPGYVVPTSFVEWPAHGDVSQGFANNLAPFVDVDQDGAYDPSAGDYPCIRGDRAVYLIMNDKGGLHLETGGDPIGLEMHFMVYQFDAGNYLDDVTFVHTKLINRGTQTLYDFRMGSFVDGELGGGVDDYVGCDTTRNMMFTYNGDAIDGDVASQVGYGENPPAIGVVSLNREMSAAAYFSNGVSFPYTDPQTATGFYNFMNGKWANGTNWVHGGLGYAGSPGATNTPTKFMFPGNPVTGQGWSEVSNSNPPGDRRMLLVSGLGIFSPNDEVDMDYAFVYARSTATIPFAGVDALYSAVDNVQTFYDNQMNTCDASLNVTEEEMLDFSITPNPNNGVFQIKGEILQSADITIFDVAGRVVEQKLNVQQSSVSISLNETPGVYMINITNGGKSMTKRVIIK